MSSIADSSASCGYPGTGTGMPTEVIPTEEIPTEEAEETKEKNRTDDCRSNDPSRSNEDHPDQEPVVYFTFVTELDEKQETFSSLLII